MLGIVLYYSFSFLRCLPFLFFPTKRTSPHLYPISFLRCFYFAPPHPDLARTLNLYRLYPSSPGAYAPPIAFNSYAKDFEAPEEAEGFSEEVKRIGWRGWWEEREKDHDPSAGTGSEPLDEEHAGVGDGVKRKRKRWEGWMS